MSLSLSLLNEFLKIRDAGAECAACQHAHFDSYSKEVDPLCGFGALVLNLAPKSGSLC